MQVKTKNLRNEYSIRMEMTTSEADELADVFLLAAASADSRAVGVAYYHAYEAAANLAKALDIYSQYYYQNAEPVLEKRKREQLFKLRTQLEQAMRDVTREERAVSKS